MSPGNYGLLDMIALFEWIKKNIAAFGAIPNKVTIFGESAGAIAVSQLCASPLAKGLFEGAISESGGSSGTRAPRACRARICALADAERSGVEFARTVGVSSIAELRKRAGRQVAGRTRGLFWPIIDGYVIPSDQYSLYDTEQFNDIRS